MEHNSRRKTTHIYICEKYFTKKFVNICVFHIYFVILQQNFNVMSDKERIEKVMSSLGLNARQFATEIHVQPGTISNMMSGRNNPSLEVMKRIMDRYPTLNPEWLIAGRGEMWRTAPGKEPGLFDAQAPDPKEKAARASQKTEEPQVPAAPLKKISKIVVYYSDNTFEEYTTATPQF